MKRLSFEELESLAKKAKKGDEAAETALRKYNVGISSIANKRLERLEKNAMDYYAYDRATTFIDRKYGGKRFRRDYIALPETSDLYRQILEVEKFLQAESSTVRGQKRIQKERINTFREMGIDIPQIPAAEKAFIQFLNDSDMFDRLKKSFGSEQLLGYIADMLAPRNTRTRRLNQIAKAFKETLDENQPVDDIFADLGVDILEPPKNKIKRKRKK